MGPDATQTSAKVIREAKESTKDGPFQGTCGSRRQALCGRNLVARASIDRACSRKETARQNKTVNKINAIELKKRSLEHRLTCRIVSTVFQTLKYVDTPTARAVLTSWNEWYKTRKTTISSNAKRKKSNEVV